MKYILSNHRHAILRGIALTVLAIGLLAGGWYVVVQTSSETATVEQPTSTK